MQKEDRALEILVTLLSQVVHRQEEEGGPRERLLGQAREAEHRIAMHGSNASASCVSTLRLLLRLFDFYDFFHSQQHTRALDVSSPTSFPSLCKEIGVVLNILSTDTERFEVGRIATFRSGGISTHLSWNATGGLWTHPRCPSYHYEPPPCSVP